MNRFDLEETMSAALCLLELLYGQLSAELEESDAPQAGAMSCGLHRLVSRTQADLQAAIAALPRLDLRVA